MEKIKNLVQPIAGDTDSIVASTMIYGDTFAGTIEELFKKSAEGRVLKQTLNGTLMTESDVKCLNWSESKGLHYAPIVYISKHLVKKNMWKLRGKSGKEVIVTEDHSLIVFRDGKKLEVKPKEILPTDKILIVFPLK